MFAGWFYFAITKGIYFPPWVVRQSASHVYEYLPNKAHPPPISDIYMHWQAWDADR